MTVVVGPPGTGKTDVAVQIANNLYRNFRDEKILVLAHSNAALDDIFSKIKMVFCSKFISCSIQKSIYSICIKTEKYRSGSYGSPWNQRSKI